MGRKPKPFIPPKPRTVFEHLAAQSGTNASDWRYVPRGTDKYRQGYHYWHPGQNLYAKRNQEDDSATLGGTPEPGSAAGVPG